MGLKATIAAAVDTAIAAVDDLAVTITYHKITIGGYDVDTDADALTTVNVTVTGILYSGKDVEQDSVRRLTFAQSKNTSTDETRVLIGANSLPAYTPKTTDRMTIGGKLYEIFGMIPIPGNPAWIFQVRYV